MAELADIPEDQVLQVIEDFILAGNEKITAEKQQNGNWTVKGE